MKISKSLLSLVVPLILLVSSSAHAGEKVVVIVDGNDFNPKGLAGIFKRASDEAASIYQKNGYRVIRIEAQKGMGAPDFRNAISNLKNIDELSIDFFTHGVIRNDFLVPDKPLRGDDLKRFPKSYLRPDEVSIARGHEITGPVRYAFAMQVEKKDANPNADWIGLGDLHQSIQNLRSANPNAKVNIIALSCFSSNATRGLQDIPNVQVFTGSAASQTGLVFPKKDSLSNNTKTDATDNKSELVGNSLNLPGANNNEINTFTLHILDELKNGESYLSAFAKGRESYLRDQLQLLEYNRDDYNSSDNELLLVRPQSSLELLLADQCLGHPPKVNFEPACVTLPSVFQNTSQQASTLTQPLLIDYLSKQIEADTKHLASAETLYDCDPEIQSKEASIRKTALKRARKQLERELDSFKKADFEELIHDLESKKDLAKNAKSADELLVLMDNSLPYVSSLDYEFLKMVAKKKGSDSIETTKGNILRGIQRRVFELQSPDIIDSLRSTSKAHLNQMDKEASRYSQSLADPMNWNLSDFFDDVLDFRAPYRLPARLRQKKLQARAKLLIDQKCPSSKVFDASMDQKKRARIDQLNCVESNTTDDAFLRMFALDAVAFQFDGKERERACRSIFQEKEKNEKLKGCLANPSKLGDEKFWNQMNALYVQGESHLVEPSKK